MKIIATDKTKSMEKWFGIKILPCPFPLPAGVVGLVVPPVDAHGEIDLRNAIVIKNQKEETK